jgi:hypothetical protein
MDFSFARKYLKVIVAIAAYEAFFLSIYNGLKVQVLAQTAGTLVGGDPGFWLVFLGTAIPTFLLGTVVLTFILCIGTVVGGVFFAFLGNGLATKDRSAGQVLVKIFKVSCVASLVLVGGGLAVEASIGQALHATTDVIIVYVASGILGGVPFVTVVITFIATIFTFMGRTFGFLRG